MTELPNRLLRDALADAASNTLSPACVDIDTLAAWAEGTLSRAERAALDAHAAGCGRCLALLAAMARTEPPPIERAWWRRSLVWLLPLATATAALVIVVRLAVIEQRSPARDMTASAPAATPLRPPSSNPAPASAPALGPAPAAPEPARAPAPAAAPEPAPAAAPDPARAPTRAPAPAPAAAPAPAPAPSPSTSEAVATNSAVRAPAAAPASPPQTAAAASPPQMPATEAPPRPAQVAVSSAARDALADEARARGFVAKPMMKAAAAAPVVIASPDPASQWRLVDGAVEHTADGGLTWQRQPIGVASPMRAGAAPSPRVCWLVGTGGVVLRTIDGVTWTPIAFPEAADLGAVVATDAAHATVTTSSGLRLTTTDGGTTWIRQ